MHASADKALENYKRTGLHATFEEVDEWLGKLASGERIPPPKCHTQSGRNRLFKTLFGCMDFSQSIAKKLRTGRQRLSKRKFVCWASMCSQDAACPIATRSAANGSSASIGVPTS